MTITRPRAPRDPPHRTAQPVAGDHPAQPHPHQADARDADGRHHPAGDVRAAVRLRLRRLDRGPGRGDGYNEWLMAGIMGQTIAFASFIVASGSPPTSTRASSTGCVRCRSTRLRPGRPQPLQPDPLQHRHRGDVAHRPADRLADPDSVFEAALGYGLLLMWGFAMIWVGILVGSAMRSVEAVHGLMFTDDLPAHVPGQHVRSDREHARMSCARSPSGTRSPRWSRPSGSCGATARPRPPTRRCRCSTRSWHADLDDPDHRGDGAAVAAGVPAPHRRLTRHAAGSRVR